MSFAILLKDSKPTGVTDSKAVETAARPPDPFSGFKRAANLDLLAEDIGYGVAVFLLGKTAQTHHVGISRRRGHGDRSTANRQTAQEQEPLEPVVGTRARAFSRFA